MPSDANKNQKQRKGLVYFVDRSLPKKSLLAALITEGCIAQHHDDLFPENAPDTDWLQAAGKNGWIVLSHDRRIGRNPLEIQCLYRAGVCAFMPASRGGLSGQETTDIIINAIPAIERFYETNKPPYIARIYRDGSVKKWRG